MQPKPRSYPLATTSWDDAEFAAMEEVIRSGNFTMGERVAGFEAAFARYTGARHCVMVNSGSSANLLMVAALFYDKRRTLRAGDEAIVPAVSWATTYYPLHQYGLKVKFVDIDRATLNFDLDALADAVTNRTRLIVGVNLLGNPNDFARLRSVIDNREITLIEDNCESMGAEFQGKQAGTFGALGSFSTFFSHHMSTMEGGMVVTDNEELHHILLSLRAHGWTRNLPKHNHVCGTKSDDPFVESFRFVLPGYNVRPLELSGAIGIEQLKKLPKFIDVRRRNAARFLEVMREFPYLETQAEIGRSSWFGFSMVLSESAPYTRAHLIRTLETHGIDVRPIVAGDFTRNEVVKWFDHTIHGDLRNARYIDKNGLFVGNHQYDLDSELRLLHAALSAAQIGKGAAADA